MTCTCGRALRVLLLWRTVTGTGIFACQGHPDIRIEGCNRTTVKFYLTGNPKYKGEILCSLRIFLNAFWKAAPQAKFDA